MVRVLQLIGQLGRGGDTTVVLNVMRKADPSRIHFDFMTHDRADMEVVAQLRSEGHMVHVLPGDMRKMGIPGYYRMVSRILKESPVKYDVFHAHTSLQSGIALLAAKQQGIPKRICHSHTNGIQNSTSTLKKLTTPVFRYLIRKNATDFAACSRMAGNFLFGETVPYQLIYNGVATERFRQVDEEKLPALRKELGIRESDVVIGHVAHFGNLKNQKFDLEMASALRDREDIRFVLTGKGANFEKISSSIQEQGLTGKVILTGQRSDIPELMNIFDTLILPSLPGEGFPVTVMEAQAAGCPCIISDYVTPEVEVGLGLVKSIPLADKAQWLKSLRCVKQNRDFILRRERSFQLEDKGFGAQQFADNWLSLYE
ncbi:MAG: glycosyltransferase [Lachnospiraceae bacterium]|nr:glycosyltransferase [Lachnospiraceae bacterium]